MGILYYNTIFTTNTKNTFSVVRVNEYDIILLQLVVLVLCSFQMGNRNVFIFVICQTCNAFINAIKDFAHSVVLVWKLDPVNPLLYNASNIMYNIFHSVISSLPVFACFTIK